MSRAIAILHQLVGAVAIVLFAGTALAQVPGDSPVRETLHGLMVSRDLMIQKNPGASRKTSESTKKLSKKFRKRGRRTIHGKASAKN